MYSNMTGLMVLAIVSGFINWNSKQQNQINNQVLNNPFLFCHASLME